MIDTAAFVIFCLTIVLVSYLAVKLDDGVVEKKGPWRPKRRATDEAVEDLDDLVPSGRPMRSQPRDRRFR